MQTKKQLWQTMRGETTFRDLEREVVGHVAANRCYIALGGRPREDNGAADVDRLVAKDGGGVRACRARSNDRVRGTERARVGTVCASWKVHLGPMMSVSFQV